MSCVITQNDDNIYHLLKFTSSQAGLLVWLPSRIFVHMGQFGLSDWFQKSQLLDVKWCRPCWTPLSAYTRFFVWLAFFMVYRRDSMMMSRSAMDQQTHDLDRFTDQSHGSDNFSDQQKKKKKKDKTNKHNFVNAAVISGCWAFVFTPVSETLGWCRFKCVAMLDVFPLSYGFLVPQCRHTVTVLSTNLFPSSLYLTVLTSIPMLMHDIKLWMTANLLCWLWPPMCCSRRLEIFSWTWTAALSPHPWKSITWVLYLVPLYIFNHT